MNSDSDRAGASASSGQGGQTGGPPASASALEASRPVNPSGEAGEPRSGRLKDTSVVVIGSGFGGLATACYLAADGADVTVVEKNEQPGGRASRLEAEGFRFDMGPSWYLMPDVFEAFFATFGRRPSDYYELVRLDPHYRIYFKDGDQVDISPSRSEVHRLFERYEAGASQELERYLEVSRENYEIGMAEFVYKDRESLGEFVSASVARHAGALKFFGSMQDHVSKYFEHPKLRQIMQYTLVFLGGSPANTPALYNLMGHVDFNLGVYYPKDGIGAVVEAIVGLAEELGVTFVYDAEATAIRRTDTGPGRLAVETQAGRFEADVVVSDADYAHTERDLLEPEDRQYSPTFWKQRTYAPSAFLLYLGVEGDVPELAHHTLVLPTDWDPHFEQIFDVPAWPDDPAYYLCVPSKTDPGVAPPGHTNLFALVPIAAGLSDNFEERRAFRSQLLADIRVHTGADLEDRIVFERSFCVSDFASRYNSEMGTALGLAHTLRQTSFLRPRHRSKKVPGLYFVGANTTPGIGVPMCLISGKITAEMVSEDREGNRDSG